MAQDFGNLYFRIRDNGAAVFRIDPENRLRRLELEPIATVNARGVIKPHGSNQPSAAEVQAITAWAEARARLLEAREFDDAQRLVEAINLGSHWVQSKASDAQVEAVMNDLLLAMHDLRAALVRRKSRMLEDGAD